MIAKWRMGVLALSLAPSPVAAQAGGDETQIRAVEAAQAAAWNAHDSARYAALFTADAQVVNVLGWHWRSRQELQTKLAAAFASVFARSTMTIVGTDVQWVKPDVAVAHVTWTMTGAASPTGAGSDAPEQGIQTQVLVKRAGTWRISAFQNTNSVPERPFPAPQR
jgi:uncharacterized protein (TIGR02246 family)